MHACASPLVAVVVAVVAVVVAAVAAAVVVVVAAAVTTTNMKQVDKLARSKSGVSRAVLYVDLNIEEACLDRGEMLGDKLVVSVNTACFAESLLPKNTTKTCSAGEVCMHARAYILLLLL